MMALVILILLSLLFAFLNGLNDSSSIVATAIASGAMEPRRALALAALCDFSGPFLFGVAVAGTIGNGYLAAGAIQLRVLIGAVLAAIVWNMFTAGWGIPSSSSHALIGGLLGAAMASGGLQVIYFERLARIVGALLLSPPLGLLGGFAMMRGARYIFRESTPLVSERFRRMQLGTVIAMGLSHGANDGPKSMALIGMGLLASGRLGEFGTPWWVMMLSAGAMALGTSLGGWQLIRTLGGRIFRIRPMHAFCSQLASSGLVIVAALVGLPISATQVVSSSIMGVGGGERANQVRWGLLSDMAISWSLTIPATALLGAIFVWSQAALLG